MDDVTQIKRRGAIALSQIAEAKLVYCAEPLCRCRSVALRLQPECVAPGIVHIELHPMPLLLAEIELQRMIVAVPGR